jgi:putative ABC transport system ATP-binding protein
VPPNTPPVEADGLTVRLDRVSIRFGAQVVLQQIRLDIEAGESVAIMGPSGSGKTSLLRCIMGLLGPDTGTVRVGEWDLGEMLDAERSALRRSEMGLVFQSADLLPELTVAENVALTRIFDGEPRRQALARAEASLRAMGLAQLRDRSTDQLSGGEAQRVAVARALCRDELGLVVADEPTASLDRATADLVTALLVKQTRARGVTLVLATHDLAVADRCDRIIDLAGSIVTGTSR